MNSYQKLKHENMEDTPISLQTAKLAKEKGFNLFCDKGYFETYAVWTVWAEADDGVCFFAPTQSLLAKWLREVHNIKVFVSYEGIGSDDYEYGYIIKYEEGDGKRECERLKIIESIHFYPSGYGNNAFPANTQSYEEVFEEGLRKALTLIP